MNNLLPKYFLAPAGAETAKQSTTHLSSWQHKTQKVTLEHFLTGQRGLSLLVFTTSGRKHSVLRRPRDGQRRQLWASFLRSLKKHGSIQSLDSTAAPASPLPWSHMEDTSAVARCPALSPLDGSPVRDWTSVDALLFSLYLSGFSRVLDTHSKKICCHFPFPVNLNCTLKSSGETEKTHATWAPPAEILICLIRAWLPRWFWCAIKVANY